MANIRYLEGQMDALQALYDSWKNAMGQGEAFGHWSDMTVGDIGISAVKAFADRLRAMGAFDATPKTVTHIDPKAVPVVEFPIAEVLINKDVPNFKEDADLTTGVIPSEKLEAAKYERRGTAPVVLWRKANGEVEIITGRHRLDLAKRTGETTIPAQIVEESKGFTKDMALTFDAEANIRDGNGSIRDYAHYFKLTPDLTEATARSRGLLSRSKGQAGWHLAKSASDDLYALWRDDKLTESKALAIAKAAPGDAAKQQLGIRLAKEGKDSDYIRARLERERAKTESPVQTDMFGNPIFDDARSDAETARVVEIRRDLKDQIRAAKNAANNPEAAAQLGIDVKDPEGTRTKIAELQSELEAWEGTWWLDRNLVAKVKGEPITAAQPPNAPKLNANVNQTDMIDATQKDTLSLTGEVTGDAARIKAEAEAKAKLAAEAKALEAKQQQDLFAPTPPDAPPSAEGGTPIGQGPGGMTRRASAKPEAPETLEGTGLKHAIDELERISYGFKERTPQDRQAMAEAWVRAGDLLAKDREAGRRLAQALVDNPRRGLTGDRVRAALAS